jgi:hypothetical protein
VELTVKRRASAKDEEAAKARKRQERRSDFFMGVCFIDFILTIISISNARAIPI